MMGYLNSESPFDDEGWYDTKDLVEVKGDFIKVVGRTTDVVNVAGLKFLTSEVESIAVNFPGISDLSIFVKSNPITGQHIEMTIRVIDGVNFDKENFKEFLISKLPRHMMPQKILLGDVAINHRFKKG
jgi:acyl-CoA synthetase (AMP-forming)/AMP-acid ligase II